MDYASDHNRPFDGQWETGDGLRVIIDGAAVRWPKNETSELKIHSKSECSMSVGDDVYQGHLVSMPVEGWAQQELRWDDGDVWVGGVDRAKEIGGSSLFDQTMTDVLRDSEADEAAGRRSVARLGRASTGCLGLVSMLAESLSRFIGSDVYYVEVSFLTRLRPPWVTGSFLNLVSWRHPKVAFRHRWAEQVGGFVGQRLISKGEEVGQECYGRAIRLGDITWHVPFCREANCLGVCLENSPPLPQAVPPVPASPEDVTATTLPECRGGRSAQLVSRLPTVPARRREGQEYLAAPCGTDAEVRYSGAFADLLAFSGWGRSPSHAPAWSDLM